MTMLQELDLVLPRLTMMLMKDTPLLADYLSKLHAKLKAGAPEEGLLRTVDDARAALKESRGYGVDCEVCFQHAKIYKRPLSANMTRPLLDIIRVYCRTRDWIDCKQFRWKGGDYAKLAYWKLIEFQKTKASRRRQGGPVRPTRKGVEFALALTSVPSHAVVYNTNCIRLEGDEIKIHDVKGFDPDSIKDVVLDAANLPW